MLWLVLGIAIGFTWHWLLGWSRARGVRISWLVWALLILTITTALSGVANYIGLIMEYEERAAATMPRIYGEQTLIFAVPALLLLWWQVRRAAVRRAT